MRHCAYLMAGVKGRSGRWRKLDQNMLADVRKLSLREGLRFLKDKSISPDKKAPYIFGVIGKMIPDQHEVRRLSIDLTQDAIDRLLTHLERTPEVIAIANTDRHVIAPSEGNVEKNEHAVPDSPGQS